MDPTSSSLFGHSREPFVASPTPENRIDLIEQEADEQAQINLAAKQRGIAKIRSTIAQMRAQGKSGYEINRAIDDMLGDFYRSINSFSDNNTQYGLNKAQVSACSKAIEGSMCTVKLKPLKLSGAVRERPSFAKADEAYYQVYSLYQLKTLVGGKLKENYDGKIFKNGCAARISYVLLKAGIKIPAIPGETVSGANGEQYIYRLSTLDKFMRKTFGPPDCEWKKDSVVSEKCRDLKGRKGILISRWGAHADTTCTGHATLINGRSSTPPSDGLFWELSYEKED